MVPVFVLEREVDLTSLGVNQVDVTVLINMLDEVVRIQGEGIMLLRMLINCFLNLPI